MFFPFLFTPFLIVYLFKSSTEYKSSELDLQVKEIARGHLSPFSTISRVMIDNAKKHALNKHHSRNTTVIFTYSQGRLTLDSSKFNTHHLWDQQRLSFINETLYSIVNRRYFRKKQFEFVYNTHDCPVRKLFQNDKREIAPIFGNLKCNDVIIPFPQWYYRRDGSFFKMSWYTNVDWYTTWKQRSSKAMFRGFYRTSCLNMNFTFYNMNKASAGKCGRGRIMELAHDYPDLLDVGLFTSEEDYSILSTQSWYQPKDYLSIEQQSSQFRFVIYAEGNCGWADRLKMLLTSGMLIILQETPCSEWYFALLKPFVHFVPVKNDWSNLIEMIHWAKNNDYKSRQIVSNAMALGRYLMNYAVWEDYLYELLYEYSEKVEL